MDTTILKVDKSGDRKTCSTCGETKHAKLFRKGRGQCNKCRSSYLLKWAREHPERKREIHNASNYRCGICKPMSESKESSQYLGVYVAERVLRNCGLFQHIEKMPLNHPGIDFRCGKGFGIDVKSSCLHQGRWGSPHWAFTIKGNDKADFFMLIGFDDREGLNPLHVWLVPGYLINMQGSLTITNNEIGLAKWAKYEQAIGLVASCCDKLKN